MNIASRTVTSLACMATLAMAASPFARAAAMPSTPQPALTAMVEPYAEAMRNLNISTVVVRADTRRVQLFTEFGAIYFAYPSGLAATAFVVHMETGTPRVDSDAFTPAQSADYEAAIKAVLPEAIRRTSDNNRMMIERRNTWR